MPKSMQICMVENTYLSYLRSFDEFVSLDPNSARKFIGVLFEVNGHQYCAPMSSPKTKHRNISAHAPDVVKIDGGALGVINLNNMIPVVQSAIISLDIAKVSDPRYQTLLTKQMIFITTHEQDIKRKALRLYRIVNSGAQPKLTARCCNYSLLDEMAAQFGVVAQTMIQEAAPGEEREEQ